jgi:O-antigen ligase
MAINMVFTVHEYFWFNALPVVATILLLYFFSIDRIILIIAFSAPLSIILSDGGVSVYLPTEPLLFGVLVLSFFKFILNPYVDKKILRHPISIIVFIQLIWIFITSLTSSMPLVSFKFLLSRLWFVIPFYFIGITLFREKKNVKRYIYLYATSMFIVVVYTLIHHYQRGFDGEAAHWVMSPFFKDHTSYGAILSMIIPVVIGFTFLKKTSRQKTYIGIFLSLIFIVALYYSYSRAAWLSTVASLSVFLAIYFRIKFKWVALIVIVVIGIFFSVKNQLMMDLEKNRQDSSEDFMEHVQSMSNVSSDASNLERLNRWQCALRMYKERPVFGWGPGTYQFVYAPFQSSREKTIISTNAGDMGTAHSEYLGPLSEQGIPGIVLILFLVSYVSYLSLRIIKQQKGENKLIIMFCYLGLLSYFIHGGLNNFLDTDKASALFWGYIAIIVSFDIYKFDEVK